MRIAAMSFAYDVARQLGAHLPNAEGVDAKPFGDGTGDLAVVAHMCARIAGGDRPEGLTAGGGRTVGHVLGK